MIRVSAMTDSDDTCILELPCKNRRYTVLLRRYLARQLRIQVTDLDRPDNSAPAGHGSIVRELCTYRPDTAVAVILNLVTAIDPEEIAQRYARPWNCEGPGLRIRLDNRSEDRPELIEQRPREVQSETEITGNAQDERQTKTG